eukprot:gene13686-15740_t
MADRSSRAKKNKFSLEGLKEAREGGVSRLDQLELEDEGDVYEMVDEDQYASIVERRRNEDDFVVDDNGLGYHDDGEEHLGVGEDAYDAKKRLKESARDGDNRLSKKARKLAESSLGPKNSILRHMQAAGPGAANRAPSSKKESMQTELDIDSLLGAGPSAPAAKPIQRPPFGQPRLAARPPVRAALPPTHRSHYAESNHDTSDQDFGADYSDNYAGEDHTEHLVGRESFTPEAASPAAAHAEESTNDVSTAATNNNNNSNNVDQQPKISLTKSTKKLVKSEPTNSKTTSAYGYKPDLSGNSTLPAFNDPSTD